MKLASLAALTLALAFLAPDSTAQRVDRKLRKSIESIARDWFEARPKSYFEEWDEDLHAELLERARALEAFPGADLEQIVEILWKEVRKQAPKWKQELPTAYGRATWIQKGKGGPKSGLVIGLHGGGEGAGDASEAASNWTVRGSGKGQLGLYPQGIRLVHDTWNTVHGERFILSLIEYAKARYDIDPDRVYVMGFSMGSTGSWFMAGRHPDLFAGAIPAHGVFMAAPRSQLERKQEVQSMQHGLLPNVRNLAVYFYTGTADRNCMPGTFLYAWDVLQKLRAEDPGGYEQVVFTLHEGLAHAFAPGEPEKGIEFVTAQRRDTFPRKLVWEYAADPFPLPAPDELVTRIVKRRFYWLRCSDPQERMRVSARRAGNTIELEIEGADPSTFTILLNPSMIDVTSAVEVRVGGEQVYLGRPEPEFATVLRSLDEGLDRRMVFDRQIEVP